jgi:hypothetical protein
VDILLGVGLNVSKLGSLLSFFLMCGVTNVLVAQARPLWLKFDSLEGNLFFY